MQVKPNLFLIGAMRSGSTSLHLLLGQHPEIFMTDAKEPMFYVAEEMRNRLQFDPHKVEVISRLDTFVRNGKYRSRKSYFELFSGSKNMMYRGESSHYLYAPQVAKTIFSDRPDARIIISLRDPVERLYSEYLYYRRANLRSCDFIEFSKEGCRFDADENLVDIGKKSRIHKGFYSQLITPWLETFGQDQVKIVFFDDIKKNPVNVVKCIYHWLGVDSNFTPKAVHAQQGGVPQKENILNFVEKSYGIKSFAKILFPKIMRVRLRSFIYSKVLDKGKIDPESEAFLSKVYSDDINKLEKLLNIDLNNWK